MAKKNKETLVEKERILIKPTEELDFDDCFSDNLDNLSYVELNNLYESSKDEVLKKKLRKILDKKNND
jgi:hypothetical protein